VSKIVVKKMFFLILLTQRISAALFCFWSLVRCVSKA